MLPKKRTWAIWRRKDYQTRVTSVGREDGKGEGQQCQDRKQRSCCGGEESEKREKCAIGERREKKKNCSIEKDVQRGRLSKLRSCPPVRIERRAILSEEQRVLAVSSYGVDGKNGPGERRTKLLLHLGFFSLIGYASLERGSDHFGSWYNACVLKNG